MRFIFLTFGKQHVLYGCVNTRRRSVQCPCNIKDVCCHIYLAAFRPWCIKVSHRSSLGLQLTSSKIAHAYYDVSIILVVNSVL